MSNNEGEENQCSEELEDKVRRVERELMESRLADRNGSADTDGSEEEKTRSGGPGH